MLFAANPALYAAVDTPERNAAELPFQSRMVWVYFEQKSISGKRNPN
jgi:hypothetical protein